MEKIIYFIRDFLFLFFVFLFKIIFRSLIQPCCCYYPSCSQYAFTAIKKFGILKGSYISILRIIRCNPWSIGGYDPLILKKRKEKKIING